MSRITVPTHDMNGRKINKRHQQPTIQFIQPHAMTNISSLVETPPPPYLQPMQFKNTDAMTNTSSLVEARPIPRPLHDHKKERDAIKLHNERRDALLEDAQRLIPGYVMSTPWYNPFGERRSIYVGDRVQEKNLNDELKKGTRQYVNDVFEESNVIPRSRLT